MEDLPGHSLLQDSTSVGLPLHEFPPYAAEVPSSLVLFRVSAVVLLHSAGQFVQVAHDAHSQFTEKKILEIYGIS